MKPIFKPKNKLVQVPGFGIVSKEDFNEDHLKACLKQVKDAKLDENAYLNKHMEIVSYGNLPLFSEAEEAAKKAKEEEEAAAKAEAELKAKKEAEEAEVLKQLEAEEAAKKAATKA